MSHWTRHFSDDGIDYYHNSLTNETVWDTPEDYVSSGENSEEEYDTEMEEGSEGEEDESAGVDEDAIDGEAETKAVQRKENELDDGRDEKEKEGDLDEEDESAGEDGEEEEVDPEAELIETQMREAEIRAQQRQRAVEHAEADARSELEAETKARTRTATEETVESKEGDEEWRSEVDFTDGFLGELQMWGLFDKPALSDEGLAIDREKAQLMKKHLEEGTGTDDDWVNCFQANNFAVVEYMLLLVDVVEDSVLVLAHAGNLYPYLWADFVTSHKRLVALVSSTIVGAQKVSSCFMEEREVKMDRKNYIGYDERDDEAYGAYNVNKDADEDAESLKQKEDREQQTIAANLFMVFHAYTEDIPFLKATLRSPTPKVIFLEDLKVKNDNLATLASSDGNTSTIPKLLKAICVFLLVRNIHYTEEAYLTSIRVMACLNHQFVHDLEQQSTEMASILSHTQINDAEAVGISEGIMHLLNGVGYPSHTEPETFPVVRLCADLIMASTDGYFYSNDLAVMADVVIRELQNIPPIGEDAEETSKHEELRVYYIHLAGALLNRQLLDGSKDGTVRDTLTYLHEEGAERPESEWSSDVAAAILEAY